MTKLYREVSESDERFPFGVVISILFIISIFLPCFKQGYNDYSGFECAFMGTLMMFGGVGGMLPFYVFLGWILNLCLLVVVIEGGHLPKAVRGIFWIYFFFFIASIFLYSDIKNFRTTLLIGHYTWLASHVLVIVWLFLRNVRSKI